MPKREEHYRAKLFQAALAGAALALIVLPAGAAASRWALETDPDLGLRYSYPSDVFSPIEGDEKPYFHYVASPSSEAKFLVGGWNNAKGQSLKGFKQWLIENVGGYDETIYRPRGLSWFVLSGYRGDSISYEKVMFSCGDSLVNVFALSRRATRYVRPHRGTDGKCVQARNPLFLLGERTH